MSATASPTRYLLVSCQVFEREITECLGRTDRTIEVEYLPMGIHGDTAEHARASIQDAVDLASPQRHGGVLIGFGVCNNGVRGLVARQLPLIIPRAYDCISLLMGSRKRYRECLQNEPDTYFKTPGWVDAAQESQVILAVLRHHGSVWMATSTPS